VPEIVIDASALLALLNTESGADVVAEALPGGVISAVNLSEVVAKLCEAGMPENAIRQALQPLGLEVEPFDEEQAYQAGWLRGATQRVGLSLRDRACLSLAQRLALPVLTADRTWSELSVGVTVRVIR
jgi:PIN domain nuclease of toxin-antitoxin system